MEYQVLYNPKAGNGQGWKTVEKLPELLPDDQLFFQDITKLTDYAAFLDGISPRARLLLAGGDGTLNRFINDTAGLQFPNAVYYYATGSGNDFLCDLGKEKGCAPFCIDPYLKDLPAVFVQGRNRRFLNGIGYGIDGYCCLEGDAQREETTKPVNYAAIAVKGLLFHYKPTDAVITVDGVRHTYKRVWLAPTMNGRYYGGGMMPAPGQDRLGQPRKLTVMVFHRAGKLKTLTVFPSIFKGKHVEHRNIVETLSGHEIVVEFSAPRPLQIDGETIPNARSYRAVSAANQPADAAAAVGARIEK